MPQELSKPVKLCVHFANPPEALEEITYAIWSANRLNEQKIDPAFAFEKAKLKTDYAGVFCVTDRDPEEVLSALRKEFRAHGMTFTEVKGIPEESAAEIIADKHSTFVFAPMLPANSTSLIPVR